MLAVLNMKWAWRKKRIAQGKPHDKPNLVRRRERGKRNGGRIGLTFIVSPMVFSVNVLLSTRSAAPMSKSAGRKVSKEREDWDVHLAL